MEYGVVELRAGKLVCYEIKGRAQETSSSTTTSSELYYDQRRECNVKTDIRAARTLVSTQLHKTLLGRPVSSLPRVQEHLHGSLS